MSVMLCVKLNSYSFQRYFRLLRQLEWKRFIPLLVNVESMMWFKAFIRALLAVINHSYHRFIFTDWIITKSFKDFRRINDLIPRLLQVEPECNTKHLMQEIIH